MRQRTHTLLQQLARTSRSHATQYVDVDRTATTPERFLRVGDTASPFRRPQRAAGARAAFDAALAFLPRATRRRRRRRRSCSTNFSSSARLKVSRPARACCTIC
jgi:hypothetical protein